MAGRFGAVIVSGLALAAGLFPCAAADQSSPTPTASAAPSASASPGGARDLKRDFQQFINQLPPPQKERFQQNLDLWNTMTPDERKALRARYDERRKWIKGEIDNALKNAGLRLDEPTQKQFTNRYTDERRKIEQALHRELDGKRRELTKALVEKLKTEFASKSLPPTPTPSPTVSASPSASAPASASSSASPEAK